MSVSTDYTGRTVDLLIFQGVAETGNPQLELGWGEAGKLATGVQKVAQTWLIWFLTDPGTVLNKPRRGGGFISAVRSGRIRVSGDVPAVFATAANKVKQTMQLDAANEGLPDDERLLKAELLDYDFDRRLSLLRLRIKIITVAGDSRVVFLPVSVSIL